MVKQHAENSGITLQGRASSLYDRRRLPDFNRHDEHNVAMFSELSLAVLSKLTKLHPKLQCDVLTLHDIVSSPIFVTNHMPYTRKAWLH